MLETSKGPYWRMTSFRGPTCAGLVAAICAGTANAGDESKGMSFHGGVGLLVLIFPHPSATARMAVVDSWRRGQGGNRWMEYGLGHAVAKLARVWKAGAHPYLALGAGRFGIRRIWCRRIPTCADGRGGSDEG